MSSQAQATEVAVQTEKSQVHSTRYCKALEKKSLEIARLQRRVLDRDQACSEWRQHYTDAQALLDKHVDESEAVLRSAAVSLSHLEVKVKHAKAKYEEAERESCDLKEQMAAAEKDNASLRFHLDTLLTSQSNVEERVAVSRVQGLLTSCNTLRHEVASLHGALAAAEDKNKDELTVNLDLQTMLILRDAEIADITQRLQDEEEHLGVAEYDLKLTQELFADREKVLEAEVDEKGRKIKELSIVLANQDAASEANANQITSLTASRDSLISEVAFLKSALVDATETVQHERAISLYLQTSVGLKDDKIVELSSSLKSTQDALETVEYDLKLTQELSLDREKELEAEADTKEVSVAKLIAEAKQKDERIGALQHDLKSTQKRFLDREDELEAKAQRHSDARDIAEMANKEANARLEDALARVAELEAELAERDTQISEEKTHTESKSMEAQYALDENIELAQRLENATREIKAAYAKLSPLQDDNIFLHFTNKRLSSDLRRAETTIEEYAVKEAEFDRSLNAVLVEREKFKDFSKDINLLKLTKKTAEDDRDANKKHNEKLAEENIRLVAHIAAMNSGKVTDGQDGTPLRTTKTSSSILASSASTKSFRGKENSVAHGHQGSIALVSVSSNSVCHGLQCRYFPYTNLASPYSQECSLHRSASRTAHEERSSVGGNKMPRTNSSGISSRRFSPTSGLFNLFVSVLFDSADN